MHRTGVSCILLHLDHYGRIVVKIGSLRAGSHIRVGCLVRSRVRAELAGGQLNGALAEFIAQ
jgi:hypothetical protein